MKKLFAILYCLGTFACTAAQLEGVIIGKSGNVLAGVTLETAGMKTYTNDLGRFKIKSKDKSGILYIHAVGYESKRLDLKAGIPAVITLIEQTPEIRQQP